MLLTHELYQAYHSVRCLPPGMRAPFAVRPPSAACRCARCAAISTPASHRAHWLAAHARTSGGPAHAPARPSPCAGLCTDLRRQLSRTGLAWRHTAGRTSTATVDGSRCEHTPRTARRASDCTPLPAARVCGCHLVCGGLCETAQGLCAAPQCSPQCRLMDRLVRARPRACVRRRGRRCYLPRP